MNNSTRKNERFVSLMSVWLILLLVVLAMSACGPGKDPAGAETAAPAAQAVNEVAVVELSDAQLENLVKRSYQYVAMYNVNNKFAIAQNGWNLCMADTTLKDHTMADIARPNNDTLYASCMLDLRDDAIVLEIPDFDSKYVSLMVTGYDHHVNVPLATRLGDFDEPLNMLFYSERTAGYAGEAAEGIDQTFEATGDFISAVFRIMPHQTEPERLERIIEQMKSIRAEPLAAFRGGDPQPASEVDFPAVGETDADVFANNLLEVMQFVFNHTSFDANNELDQAVLEAYRPLGIAPGQPWNPEAASQIDGERIRAVAQRIQAEGLALMADEAFQVDMWPRMFQPKGASDLKTILTVSIIGPIGLPQEEALYPALNTSDGQPMNAMHDYVIRMSSDELPPATAFWSLTLYDMANGFFIPNDRKKYSVGENAGMKLDEDGGIAIYIAAEQPEGVPEENWLPISRGDLELSGIFRIYAPDLEKMKTWSPPKAEKLGAG